MRDENVIHIAEVLGEMGSGGVESIVKNYYKNVDKNKVQFDFIIHENSTYIPQKEIEALGGRLFLVPPYTKLIAYQKSLFCLFKENEYRIVHAHLNTLCVFPLFAAKLAGVPVRIAHNHSTAGKGEWKRSVMKYILRLFANILPTERCACSKYAGAWMFGKRRMQSGEIKVIPNAIDLKAFRYDKSVRTVVRKELGLDHCLVLGHVGRFEHVKNHKFLLEIFSRVLKMHPNSRLLLVGEGPLLKDTIRRAKELNIFDKTIFVGVCKDVSRMYQAMDVFVLPSFYEGLPVVGVEAQTAGLPCIFSDAMTKETKVLEKTIFMNLDEPADKWVHAILQICETYERVDCVEEMVKAGYDIKQNATELTRWYMKLNHEA